MTGLQQGTKETCLVGDDMCSFQYSVVLTHEASYQPTGPQPWLPSGALSGQPCLAWPLSLVLPLGVVPAPLTLESDLDLSPVPVILVCVAGSKLPTFSEPLSACL